MKTILLFAYITTADMGVAPPKAPADYKVPTIAKITGNQYTLVNPLKVPVVMALDCGTDVNLLLVGVGPKATRIVDVFDSDKQPRYTCVLTGYVRGPK